MNFRAKISFLNDLNCTTNNFGDYNFVIFAENSRIFFDIFGAKFPYSHLTK